MTMRLSPLRLAASAAAARPRGAGAAPRRARAAPPRAAPRGKRARRAPPRAAKGPPKGPPRLLCSPAGADADASLLRGEPWDDTVVLIDKRLGWTSFDVVAKLRGTLKRRTGNKKLKVGHAGTLDPLASGLLIVCVGRATKRIDGFVGQQKRYVGTARLGESTPSLDREGEVDARCDSWKGIKDAELDAAAMRLTGALQQLPPMFSAVHVNGERLYEKARRGETVELEPRAVTVHEARVWRASGDVAEAPTAAARAGDGAEADEVYLAKAAEGQDVHFELCCSKGTYVRSWARDFGTELQTEAHLAALRRTAIGALAVTDGPAMAVRAEPHAGRLQEAVEAGPWDVEELCARLAAIISAEEEGEAAATASGAASPAAAT